MSKMRGVVAAGHELTVAAAAEILEDGGNAFDAALAGAFMSFVAEPVFTSPGGGGFLMARRAGRPEAALFDFFVETPLKRRSEGVAFYPINADFGPATQEFHIGLGSSAAPGMIPGLFAIHEALGAALPMKRLVEPAVRAARAGFPLTAFQAYLFTVIAPILKASHGVERIFAPGGELMKDGETFRNEDLGECLEWVAEDGARLFADGDVGQAIVAESASGGGHLRADDLKAYRVALREPLDWRHRGAIVALNPPPAASGALIAFGLAYLEVLSDRGAIDASALRQAMEATNEARGAYGDGLAEQLANGSLLRGLREAQSHPAAYRGTTHVSVIDAAGNAAAISMSNGEGNGFIVGNFGFMLNNMLGEEDLASGNLGAWRPGTRLSSMMAPTLILEADGTITALGTGGSNRIRSAILQVASNLLDRGMSLEKAVEAPRLHVERDGRVSFEPGLPDVALSAFRALGEKARAWPDRNLFFGGVHAARRRRDGSMEGAGDPRRGGRARVV